MNFNITGYLIYMVITAFIIVKVGKACYLNGNVFVSELIPDHADLCKKINQTLLLAYYLLNIGYCAMTLTQWETIHGILSLVETIAFKTAIIVCIISVLHYINIFAITRYAQKIIH